MFSFFKREAAPGTLAPADFLARRADGDAVLDVRTAAEFADGHLTGATNLDVYRADFREAVERLGLPKDRPVYLYCRSGNRSGTAARLLRELGYAEAYNVGGFEGLRAAGAPTAR